MINEEIQGITAEKIPNSEALKSTQDDLKKLPVKFVAPGHGPCLKV
jgi:hypothetical protein